MPPSSGPPAVAYRLLHDLDELAAAALLVNRVWDDPTLSSAALLRAYTHAGNPTIGAFLDDELVGVSVGFLGPAGGVHLHSHITGVLPDHQHLGIGLGLKLEQRRWCDAHGIDVVTWTFDPMLARNAHFNLRKLGAIAVALLPDFYGPMDDGVNRGEVTDRLDVRWELGAPTRRGAIVRTVSIPPDHATSRATDPDAAALERRRVAAELHHAFSDGLLLVDFDAERSAYGFAVRTD